MPDTSNPLIVANISIKVKNAKRNTSYRSCLFYSVLTFTFFTLLLVYYIHSYISTEASRINEMMIQSSEAFIKVSKGIQSLEIEIKQKEKMIPEYDNKWDEAVLKQRLLLLDLSVLEEKKKELTEEQEYQSVVNHSTVFRSSDDLKVLNQMIKTNNKIKRKNHLRYELLYQSDRDGDEKGLLYRRIKDTKDVFIIIKSTENNIFGGFLHLPISGSLVNNNDKDAFLFSINHNLTFPKNKDSLTCRTPNDIMCFSFGTEDIYIADKFLTSTSSRIGFPKCYGDYKDPNLRQVFTSYPKGELFIKALEAYKVRIGPK